MNRPMTLIGLTIPTLVAALLIGCAGESLMDESIGMEGGSVSESYATAQPDAGAVNQVPSTLERKIIYTGEVGLQVESVEAFADDLTVLIAEFEGYLASSYLEGSTATSRSGTWTVRIPSERFQAFLVALNGLGEPIRVRTDSQDVSEEFYDLRARLKNKEIEEERFQGYLANPDITKVKDILEIERELSRVRGEIEQMQGRLNRLSDLTSLSTITIQVNQISEAPALELPGFGTRVGRTFMASVEDLVELGESIVLGFAAAVPWIPVILASLGVLWWAFRRLTRRATPPPLNSPDSPDAQHG